MENNQALQENSTPTNQGKMTFEGLYVLRDFKYADSNLILSTFLRGIYYGGSFFSKTPKNLFMDRYKRVAQALIISPDIYIQVACLPDDLDVILGYAILNKSKDTVLWIFVKDRWRRHGIAKSMIPLGFKYIVPQHVTQIGWDLLKKYNITENPFF